jgi:hypothetical protein
MKVRILFLRLIAVILFTVINFAANAQSANIEAMAGNNNYLFQNTFNARFKDSNFGFFNTSSLYFYYHPEQTEVMTQSYLSYKAFPWLTIAAGTFFASAPGFKTSMALQFSKKSKDLFLLIVPRMDVWRDPNFEVMTLLEYRPEITSKVRFYSRAQFMLNQSALQHNRSYENVRMGIQVGNAQVGFAFNRDHYGSERLTAHNIGIFIRHEFK